MGSVNVNKAAIREAKKILWPHGQEPQQLPIQQILAVANAIAQNWDKGHATAVDQGPESFDHNPWTRESPLGEG